MSGVGVVGPQPGLCVQPWAINAAEQRDSKKAKKIDEDFILKDLGW